MARFARIENGVVINIEEWDVAPEIEDVSHVPSETAGPGDRFDEATGLFTAPAGIPAAPDIVSRMQFRRFMLTMPSMDGGNLLDQADAAIANSGDRDLFEYWNNAAQFSPTHSKIDAIAELLELSTEELDAMFVGASALT